ncbi:hypothetical protein [Streptomyces sp. NPDC008141]|uniref:hypothetical protein n=1 Tax=Streptomyces sp. NPDC008141 TaxID=3364815 RepID=UPI0036E877E2
MPTRQQPPAGAVAAGLPGIDEAEATLVEHYPRLVRLAYLTLPASLGRHRRVLAAHSTVQRALPRAHRSQRTPRLPAQRGTEASTYRWVRTRVLRAALRHERRPRWWPARAAGSTVRWPGLPLVVGLRLFPSAGGAEELALDQALSALAAPARAAFALTVLEGLSEQEVLALLKEAGAADPEEALWSAARLRRAGNGRTESLLRSAEFDPCAVQTRPTDLLRRRQRARSIAAGAAFVVIAAAVVAVSDEANRDAGPVTAMDAGEVALARALDPELLEHAPRDEWADTSRIDFSVWPARGDRVNDTALLERALRAWARPDTELKVSATADTAKVPPAKPPRLLFAGEWDGAAVVLLHEGERVVRYAEPVSGDGPAALDFARTDNADVTTAAALVVSRTASGARYLLAPWIAQTTTRDLLAPDSPARNLGVSADGVTAMVPSPAPGGSCSSWPVLQLRSSERIVENHAFLVTDLGDLAPVHLTHTPPPSSGAPARQPREATGGPALTGWARGACLLATLRGSGVRAVNNWTYAEQELPDKGGRAAWVCTRADTWRGRGRVLVQFQPPAGSATAPGVVVAEAKDSAACSRFGQHVLAGTHWRSPSGRWFLLAAGSRAVTRISASGAVTAGAAGPTMAVPARRDARVTLSGRMRGGEGLSALGG